VLFLIHTPSVTCFLPDYHTDLAFSETLLEVRRHLELVPVALSWSLAQMVPQKKEALVLLPEVKVLSIPWGLLEREVRDSGSYLLLMEITADKEVDVGGLGRREFKRGWYVYVGSAMQGLTARIKRHLRQRKRFHWHVDYLRQAADRVVPLPIRSSRRDECDLARAAAKVLTPAAIRFGCSDCSCPTHLYWSPHNPLNHAPFHELLQEFRMRPPAAGE
jgi:sugar fermentation stimulation protein A